MDEKVDPLQARNLFNMEGEEWRQLRNKLSPTFTSGKMKGMYPLVEACATNFEGHIAQHQGENVDVKVSDTIFMDFMLYLILKKSRFTFLFFIYQNICLNQQCELYQDLLARFTTDVIGSCAFGLNVNSIKDPQDQFRVMGRRMLEVDLIQGIKNAIIFFLPKVSICKNATSGRFNNFVYLDFIHAPIYVLCARNFEVFPWFS